MFAQAYSYEFDPAQADANLQFVKHIVVPDMQRQPGFKGVQLLVDRQAGHGLGISFWDNEADAIRSVERSANPPPPPAGVTIPVTKGISVRTYEILIEVPAA